MSKIITKPEVINLSLIKRTYFIIFIVNSIKLKIEFASNPFYFKNYNIFYAIELLPFAKLQTVFIPKNIAFRYF